MNQTFSKILIVGILIVVVIGGIFAWQYFGKSTGSIQPQAKLLSFEVSPSCKSAGWIIYPVGAQAVAKGENLSRIEFWISPVGTDMKDFIYYDESEMIKTHNEWKITFSDKNLGPDATDFYAVGYDISGNKVGEIHLGNITSALTSEYPADCDSKLPYEGKGGDTSTWQTYRNEEYGFELSIPPFIFESLRSEGVLESDKGYNVIFRVDDLVQTRKNVISNIINAPDERFRDPKSTKSFAQEYINAVTERSILLSHEKLEAHLLCGETEICYQVEKYQFLEINGYPTLQFRHNFSILADNKIYRFWFGGREDLFLQNKITFETIVQSFKLISI